jgi:hypothetical protein
MVHNGNVIYIWIGKKVSKNIINVALLKTNNYISEKKKEFSVRKIFEGKEDDEFDLLFKFQE